MKIDTGKLVTGDGLQPVQLTALTLRISFEIYEILILKIWFGNIFQY